MLTTKQHNEIKCLDYFKRKINLYLDNNKQATIDYTSKINESDDGLSPEECYFLITEQGLKEVITNNRPRLRQLLDAKKWRLRMIDLWEQDIPSALSYFELFVEEPMPEAVYNFVTKTLYGGQKKKYVDELMLRHNT